MSKWIGSLAGGVESLLDKVDQAAGHALHNKESSEENAKGNGPSRTLSQWQPPPAVLTVSSTTYSPFLSAKNGPSTDKTDSMSQSGVRASSSIPSKLDEAAVCVCVGIIVSVIIFTLYYAVCHAVVAYVTAQYCSGLGRCQHWKKKHN